MGLILGLGGTFKLKLIGRGGRGSGVRTAAASEMGEDSAQGDYVLLGSENLDTDEQIFIYCGVSV